jgi:hypothetical protein
MDNMPLAFEEYKMSSSAKQFRDGQTLEDYDMGALWRLGL